MKKCTEICPFIIVKGNHDAPDDIAIFNYLGTRFPIFAVERPETVTLRDCEVFCIPWFDKANLVSGLEAATDADETTRRTIAAAGQMLAVTAAQVTEARQRGRILGFNFWLEPEVSRARPGFTSKKRIEQTSLY